MSAVKFTPSEIDGMCQRFGITRAQLHEALRQVGPKALPRNLQASWTRDNPTRGFCYRVCEAATRSGKVPAGFLLMRKKDDQGSHYFFQDQEAEEILDITADQCVNGYDYTGAKRQALLPQVSKGARMLAEALGWTIVERKAAS
jgi:hypothetical protein